MQQISTNSVEIFPIPTLFIKNSRLMNAQKTLVYHDVL